MLYRPTAIIFLLWSTFFSLTSQAADVSIERLSELSAQDPLQAIEQIDSALKNKTLALDVRLDLTIVKSSTLSRLGYLERYLENSQQGYQLASAHNRQEYMARFQLDEAEALSQLGRWSEAKKVFETVIPIVETLDNPPLLGQAHGKFGLSSYYNGEHERALKHLQQAFELISENDRTQAATILANIALVYDATGEHDTALDYFFKSLEFIDPKRFELDASITYYNIGYVSIKAKKYTQAEEYLNRSLEIAERNNIVQGVAFAKSQLGVLELERKAFEKAENYLKQSLEMARSMKNERLVDMSMFHLMQVASGLQQTEKVASLIEGLLARHGDKDDKQKVIILKHAADYYATQQDYDKSIDYYQKVITVLDEALKSNRMKEMAQAQQDFDKKLQAQELEILKQRNELQALSIEKERNQKAIFILAALVLLTSLVSAIIFLKREKVNKSKYENLAMTDELTGVANRRHILNLAEHHLELFYRHPQPIMYALIDLDYFKRINDNYGHDVGDQVLIEFACALKQALREQDLIGRFGGEEWLVVLHQIEEKDLDNVFKRIRKHCANITVPGLDEVITVSMGATLAHLEDESLETIIKRADEALYDAKHQGRNRYCVRMRVV